MNRNYYRVSDFRPFLKNPQKYINKNDKPLVARSGLEMRVFQKLDTLPTVISWSSENVFVPYQKPIFESETANVVGYEERRYIIDCWLLWKDKNGNDIEMLVEIKPKSQCYPPKEPKTKNKNTTKKYNESIKTYLINKNKWESTHRFCQDISKRRGRPIHFVLFTDDFSIISIEKVL